MIFLYNPSPVVPHLHIIKEHIYTAFIADVNKNSGSSNKPTLEANTQTYASFQRLIAFCLSTTPAPVWNFILIPTTEGVLATLTLRADIHLYCE